MLAAAARSLIDQTAAVVSGAMASPLPDLPSPLAGAIGRPFWYEAVAPFERSELAKTQVPLADGGGKRVVVVTGYLAGSRSTGPLVSWLENAGYRVSLAAVGRNMATSSAAADRIVEALHDGGEPSILIGHSRGGQQARVASVREPQLVSQLITLGSPVRAHYPRAAVIRASVEGLRLLSRLPIGPDDDKEAETAYESDLFTPFPEGVPWASIWSKADGVVEWQACLDTAAESIEVGCSHVGLIASVDAFKAIATVLDRG